MGQNQPNECTTRFARVCLVANFLDEGSHELNVPVYMRLLRLRGPAI